MAEVGTAPYHGRVLLSSLHPQGFIASSASLTHPDVRLGKRIYLGDRVIMFAGPNPGPVQIEDQVQIYGDTFLNTGWGGRILIEAGTHIQPGCHIYANISEIRIGKKVEIAARCAFYSYDHGMAPDQLIMDQSLQSKGPIVIGDGAWLGHGVIVLAGATIGAGAVIAAGSVVTRAIPENAIAAGQPARIIRLRNPSTTQEKHSVLQL